MPSPAIIALREQLRAIQGDGYDRREALPFGLPALDDRLADGGLRLDALHEVTGGTREAQASLADDACATLFVAGIAARAWGPVLWAVRGRDLFAPGLFAPGLFQAGLDPDRVIYAEGATDADVLAIMEEGLRHRGLGAVVGEVGRAGMAATRRLQLAAEGGRTAALMLKRPMRGVDDALATPSAASTRWRVSAAPSAPSRAKGVGRARWTLSLARQRGGEGFEQLVEACDATGRLALPARMAARPAATAGSAALDAA